VRRARYPESRLLFPTDENRPDGHLLRVIKNLGLRAGLNCGHCINKAGKSCATHPVCKHVILHKLRKTFASVLSRKGIPPRTIMRYLRHSELTTTLAYLDDQDDDHTRAIVETAFLMGGAA
jgi:integrase/recombinase XerD